MKPSLKEMRKKAATLKPNMVIGKGQLSEGVLAELDKILEAHEIAKIKFLRTSDPAQRDRMISILVRETRSELIETRGHTATLFRSRGA